MEWDVCAGTFELQTKKASTLKCSVQAEPGTNQQADLVLPMTGDHVSILSSGTLTTTEEEVEIRVESYDSLPDDVKQSLA